MPSARYNNTLSVAESLVAAIASLIAPWRPALLKTQKANFQVFKRRGRLIRATPAAKTYQSTQFPRLKNFRNSRSETHGLTFGSKATNSSCLVRTIVNESKCQSKPIVLHHSVRILELLKCQNKLVLRENDPDTTDHLDTVARAIGRLLPLLRDRRAS